MADSVELTWLTPKAQSQASVTLGVPCARNSRGDPAIRLRDLADGADLELEQE